MRISTLGTTARHERGAAAVEFAIVLIPLLILLLGFVDFALALNAKQAVTAAAREGVRAVALHASDADAVARARSAAAPLPADDVDLVVTQSCPVASTAETAGKVTVTYEYNFLTPLPTFVPGVGSFITLTGKGEMRCGG